MQKTRILVVDDTRLVRIFVKQAFAGLPEVSVQEAESGTKAQALLLESEFDLILCDWDMPQLDGHELLIWVRSHQHRHINQLPFIMVTGNGEKERVLKAARTGVTGYIIKPFSAQHLVRQVQTALEKRPSPAGPPDTPPAEPAPSAFLQVDHRRLRLDPTGVNRTEVAGRIDRTDPAPGILAPVVIELNLPSRRSAALSGYVSRLEAAEDNPTPSHLHIGVRLTGITTSDRDFLDEFAAALRRTK